MMYFFPDAGVLPEREVLDQHRHSPLKGVSENPISDWRILLHTRVADWLVANASPLGGPKIIVELDEPKFGKRKYNKDDYREGQWVLGGVDTIHRRVGLLGWCLKKIRMSGLRRGLKIRLFVATVESILLYGSQTWTLY